jgi:hypothetical protein
MINRGDILMLGISAGVWGALIGGSMLGLGIDLVSQGQFHGWLLMLPAAPVAALPGWLMARRLARRMAG